MGERSRYGDSLQTGQFGNEISVGAKFSTPVQTGFGACLASRSMGTGFFSGGKSGWGMVLTTNHHLALG